MPIVFLIVPVVMITIFGWAIRSLKANHERWKALPVLRQYVERHPDCKTSRGIKCFHCGSSSIRNWGEGRADSGLRTFICNHCGAKLYRSGP
ncbi:hypothetical protein [Rhodanobacter sp. BL-MT-08]